MAEGVEHALMGDHAVGARELFARLIEFIRHGVSSDCSHEPAYSMELIGSTGIDPCPRGPTRPFNEPKKSKCRVNRRDVLVVRSRQSKTGDVACVRTWIARGDGR
jgi:hypothetical protein